jgi:hypothetical protein
MAMIEVPVVVVDGSTASLVSELPVGRAGTNAAVADGVVVIVVVGVCEVDGARQDRPVPHPTPL